MPKDDQLQTLLPLSRVAHESGWEAEASGVSSTTSGLDAPILTSLLPAFLHAVPSPILVVDEDMRVVLANPAARAVLGVQQPSIEGYPVSRFLSGNLAREARAHLGVQAGPFIYADRIHNAASERELQISAELCETPAGSFVCFGFLDRTDVDRERAEWESTVQVGVRSARLERAHHLEALGHIAATFAHDFNNLLAVILGSLESAERRIKKSDDPLEDVQRALQATERSIRSTAQILHYVRRRGALLGPLEPSPIVEELRGLLERVLGDEIRLLVDARSTSRIALTETQLETALFNLIINARDAISGSGVIEIHVEDERLTGTRAKEFAVPDGNYVKISVRDSGRGMTEDVRSRALDPFFTTKAPGQGTGLGLSSVGGIVRGAGGGMTISSATDQGTRIDLMFPALPL